MFSLFFHFGKSEILLKSKVLKSKNYCSTGFSNRYHSLATINNYTCESYLPKLYFCSKRNHQQVLKIYQIVKYVDIRHHSYKNYMYFNALLDTSQNYIPTTPETSVKVPLRKHLLNVKNTFMLILGEYGYYFWKLF